MKKLVTTQYIQFCGECIYGDNNECELTGSPIERYWSGILADCPLEDSIDVEANARKED